MDEMYNGVYEALQTLDKKHNPCEWEDGYCIAMREAAKHEPLSNVVKPKSCCSSCKYLSDSGCTTRNLSCGLFYCPIAIINMKPEVFQKFGQLKSLLSTKYGPMEHFFMNEESEKAIMLKSTQS